MNSFQSELGKQVNAEYPLVNISTIYCLELTFVNPWRNKVATVAKVRIISSFA